MDIYQGDPKIIVDEDGADLKFVGGQPVMDQGLENLAIISLLTRPGWVGNDLLDDVNEKIGSDYEDSANKAITLSSINSITDAADKALSSDVFGKKTIEVSNPISNRIETNILIEPPGSDIFELILSRNGLSWQAQKINPASERI